MKGYKFFFDNLSIFGIQYVIDAEMVFPFVENEDSDYFYTEYFDKGHVFCTDLQDIVKYGIKDMRVFEVESSGSICDVVDSLKTCSVIKLIKEISLDEVKNSINSSIPAFCWATFYPDDSSHMKQFVTSSEYALLWANVIGDVDYMKDVISEKKYAEQ